MANVWRHLSHSTQGPAHLAEGAACQDCGRVRLLGKDGEEALVACVADGAGTAKHGAFGAEIACETIMASAAAHFGLHGSFRGLHQEDVFDWCEAARKEIGVRAESRQSGMRDHATTLCTAIVSSKASVFFQIGDGAIILKKRGVCGVAFWPQSGEYVNTTNFLTSPVYRDQIQFFATPDAFSDIALLTDGIERLALRFDTQVPHAPFFEPLFQVLRAGGDWRKLEEDLRSFLQSDPVRSRSDDDKTLILASCVSEEAGDPR